MTAIDRLPSRTPRGCDHGFGRLARWAVLLPLLIVLTAAPAFAQDDEDEAKPTKTVKEDVVLQTKDGWKLHITYFQSDQGKETPVVVLLHREGGNRLVWRQSPPGRKAFAKRLHDNGYAVITVDLRKHGQSVTSASSEEITARDRQRMVLLDMEAVKKFIFQEHQKKRLNMRKMAIIAPEMSAAVAVNYALIDWQKQPHDDNPDPRFKTPRGQDVRALILLSPKRRPSGLMSGPALRKLQNPLWNVAFLIGYGTGDPLDEGDARGMYKLVSSRRARNIGPRRRMYLQSYPYKFRGTDLIGKNNPKTKCEEHMLGFLDKHVKSLDSPWRDRRSRLER